MIGKSKYILIATLALCACSHTPTSPPSGAGSSVTTDTIIFPETIAGNIADSTLSIKFRSRDTNTSAILTDSNWTLITSLPLPVGKDSTVLLTIRFMPRTAGSHEAMLTLMSGSQTEMKITLIGSSAPPIPIATASIDFGIVPLWREADTAYTLHLKGIAAITSVHLSDSDWFLSNTQITIRKQDSTAVLNLAYQPESISNHVGSLYLLSGGDTLALVSLTGGTSSFERHIGDSYIFATNDSLHPIDSVWFNSSGYFSLNDSSSWFGGNMRGGGLDSSGDWLFPVIAGPEGGSIIPFGTHSPTSWNSTFGYGAGSLIGDTFLNVEGHFLKAEIGVATATNYLNRSETDQGILYADYCPDIGFIATFHLERSVNSGPSMVAGDESLIRFHLHR